MLGFVFRFLIVLAAFNILLERPHYATSLVMTQGAATSDVQEVRTSVDAAYIERVEAACARALSVEAAGIVWRTRLTGRRDNGLVGTMNGTTAEGTCEFRSEEVPRMIRQLGTEMETFVEQLAHTASDHIYIFLSALVTVVGLAAIDLLA